METFKGFEACVLVLILYVQIKCGTRTVNGLPW